MEPTINEDKIEEFEPFEEDGSVLLAAESSWRGMADELQELPYLKGAKFINQLKLIIYYGEFHPVENETNIFSAISEQSDDFEFARVRYQNLFRNKSGCIRSIGIQREKGIACKQNPSAKP